MAVDELNSPYQKGVFNSIYRSLAKKRLSAKEKDTPGFRGAVKNTIDGIKRFMNPTEEVVGQYSDLVAYELYLKTNKWYKNAEYSQRIVNSNFMSEVRENTNIRNANQLKNSKFTDEIIRYFDDIEAGRKWDGHRDVATVAKLIEKYDNKYAHLTTLFKIDEILDDWRRKISTKII